MSKNKPSKEVDPVNAWWCQSCYSDEMTHAKAMEHLRDKHGLETKGLKCRKQMVMHMDGDTWFSWIYDVFVGEGESEIKMTNKTITPRAKDDMMRYV